MKPLNKLFCERHLFSSPFLYAQQRIPVILHFADIPLPPVKMCLFSLDDLFSLRQRQAVAFDARGIMCRTYARAAAQFSLCCRRKRSMLDHGARCFDIHERAGDGGGEGVAGVPEGHVLRHPSLQ